MDYIHHAPYSRHENRGLEALPRHASGEIHRLYVRCALQQGKTGRQRHDPRASTSLVDHKWSVRPPKAAHATEWIPFRSKHIAGGAPAPVIPVWHSVPTCLLSELLLIMRVMVCSPILPGLSVVGAPVVPSVTSPRCNLVLPGTVRDGWLSS